MNNAPYTYLIRHIASGNLYHGSRTAKNCNPDELLKEKGYITSSKIIKSIIKEEGTEAFEIINIEVFDNIESAKLAEEIYHKDYDVGGNIHYFNQHNAGTKFSTSGVPRTEEEKRKIGNYWRGRKRGEEFSRKMREVNLGKKASEATKKNMSKAQTGKTRSEEHRRKIAEANKRENRSEAVLKKIGDSSRGRRHTKEAKIKMSLAQTKEKSSLYIRVSCIYCKHETNLTKFYQHSKTYHSNDENYKTILKENKGSPAYIKLSCSLCHRVTNVSSFNQHYKSCSRKHEQH